MSFLSRETSLTVFLQRFNERGVCQKLAVPKLPGIRAGSRRYNRLTRVDAASKVCCGTGPEDRPRGNCPGERNVSTVVDNRNVRKNSNRYRYAWESPGRDCGPTAVTICSRMNEGHVLTYSKVHTVPLPCLAWLSRRLWHCWTVGAQICKSFPP